MGHCEHGAMLLRDWKADACFRCERDAKGRRDFRGDERVSGWQKLPRNSDNVYLHACTPRGHVWRFLLHHSVAVGMTRGRCGLRSLTTACPRDGPARSRSPGHWAHGRGRPCFVCLCPSARVEASSTRRQQTTNQSTPPLPSSLSLSLSLNNVLFPTHRNSHPPPRPSTL